jgi:hypothetical protein
VPTDPAETVEPVDPFELPDWLGEAEVTWTASSSVRGARRISGCLRADGRELPCDLLAADVAYPRPLLSDAWRHDAHQAWEHGEVLLLAYEGRLTAAVPGTAYSADGALETIGRLARAVGVDPDRFTVCLRL